MLLVVVVDLLDGDDTWVLLGFVGTFWLVFLVPVENTADEWGDKGDASFGTGNGLSETEKKGEVAVDAFSLEVLGCLDTFPGRGDLDEDTVLVDTVCLVESDDFTCLLFGGFLVEGERSVDFGGDTTRDDVKNLSTEFDEETVKSEFNL